jgi:tetratricopeptide (TPR) repeat protein
MSTDSDSNRQSGEDSPGAEETIGARLRRLRIERGMSQRELSVQGVSYAYISRIEAGTRQPSVKALRKLASKLGVSAEYLETGSEIGGAEQRELQLAEAELQLRLEQDLETAAGTFRRVLDEATLAGDHPAAARARIALGLIAATKGNHADAVTQLEQSLLGPAPPLPATRPDVFATLGRCYAVLGRPEQAVELFERCLAETSEPENLASQVRFSIYLSYALADMGALARAQEIVSGALEKAEELTDPISLVHLNWSVARLASMQGQPSVALEYVRRAIALLEASEDTLQLGRAHLLYGYILNMEGQGSEARRHLDTAEQLLGSRRDTHDLASLRTEQARAAALQGRADEAVARAQEALELLHDEDPAERGAALGALAAAEALRGELRTAEHRFAEAVQLLEEHGRWREAAQTARGWADALAREGRTREADDVRRRAATSERRAAPAATRVR